MGPKRKNADLIKPLIWGPLPKETERDQKKSPKGSATKFWGRAGTEGEKTRELEILNLGAPAEKNRQGPHKVAKGVGNEILGKGRD